MKKNKIKIVIPRGKIRNFVSISPAMINRRADSIPDRKKNKDKDWKKDMDIENVVQIITSTREIQTQKGEDIMEAILKRHKEYNGGNIDPFEEEGIVFYSVGQNASHDWCLGMKDGKIYSRSYGEDNYRTLQVGEAGYISREEFIEICKSDHKRALKELNNYKNVKEGKEPKDEHFFDNEEFYKGMVERSDWTKWTEEEFQIRWDYYNEEVVCKSSIHEIESLDGVYIGHF